MILMMENVECLRSFGDLELIWLIFGYFLLNNTFDLYTTKERNIWFFGTLHMCISKIYNIIYDISYYTRYIF